MKEVDRQENKNELDKLSNEINIMFKLNGLNEDSIINIYFTYEEEIKEKDQT